MGIRILIADDHSILREGLKGILEKQPDIVVVGEAGDGQTTIQLARKLLPDLVIMDVSMPVMNGVEATHEIISYCPKTRVLALSVHSEIRLVIAMLKAGASGYMLKGSSYSYKDLLHAIKVVVSNHTYLSPEIANILIKDYVHLLPKEERNSAFSMLTHRECEVLQLLSEGKTTKEIASSLNVSVKTVETHRQRVMDKLNIHSIAELTKYAIREGLTSLEF